MNNEIFHKIVNILFIIGTALICLCGCASDNGEKIEGEELVHQARGELSQLHSGQITVTNNATGEVEQEMLFRYDEVGVLLYSLIGTEDGKRYYQYCNGYETYTLQNGELEVSKKGETDFYMFTYDVRHPMTDEDYLFFSPDKVISSESLDQDDGGESYTYCYESSAVSGVSTPGELKSFAMTFSFDKNKRLEYVDEISTCEKNGASTEYSYRIEITQRDSVGEIPMPEDIENILKNDEK